MPERLTDEQLREIEARANAATPGPWDEEWHPVEGYEGLYDISNFGNVRSYLKPGNHSHKKSSEPRVMSTGNRKGRRTVALTKCGQYKTVRVAKLVAQSFLGPQPAGTEIAHLNGNETDDRASNLTYCTHKENESHKKIHGTCAIGERNGASKLCGWKVAEIRYLLQKGIHQRKLSRLFDISPEIVSSITAGELWPQVEARADIPLLLAEIMALREEVQLAQEHYGLPAKEQRSYPPPNLLENAS